MAILCAFQQFGVVLFLANLLDSAAWWAGRKRVTGAVSGLRPRGFPSAFTGATLSKLPCAVATVCGRDTCWFSLAHTLCPLQLVTKAIFPWNCPSVLSLWSGWERLRPGILSASRLLGCVHRGTRPDRSGVPLPSSQRLARDTVFSSCSRSSVRPA